VGAFVALPNGVQAIIRYGFDGGVLSSRLWFVYDTPPFGVPELQGLADGLANWHRTNVLPYLSFRLDLLRVEALDWTSDPPPQSATSLVGLAGGQIQDAHSANVAVVVPFRWPIGSRLKRNKHYVPGIPQPDVDLNTVSFALSDALFEAYAALVDEARTFYPALRWRWVVTSAYEAGAARPVQFWQNCQGPLNTNPYELGQRRRRLP